MLKTLALGLVAAAALFGFGSAPAHAGSAPSQYVVFSSCETPLFTAATGEVRQDADLLLCSDPLTDVPAGINLLTGGSIAAAVWGSANCAQTGQTPVWVCWTPQRPDQSAAH